MKCSECRGDNLKTYDTRHIGDYVVRKRRCVDCDEKFYTVESYMTEEELEVIQQVERGLEDLRHGRYTEVKKK